MERKRYHLTLDGTRVQGATTRSAPQMERAQETEFLGETRFLEPNLKIAPFPSFVVPTRHGACSENSEGRGAAEVAPRRSFRRSTAAAAAAAADTAGPAARRPESQAGQATQRLDLRADCSEQVAAAVAPRRRLRSRAYADALPASAAEVIGDSDCEESPPAQQQSDDADGQPESDYCIEVLDSGSDGAALSSGEEFAASEREDSEASEGLLSSPSPPDKRRRRSRSQSQRGDARRQSMQQRQGKGRGQRQGRGRGQGQGQGKGKG